MPTPTPVRQTSGSSGVSRSSKYKDRGVKGYYKGIMYMHCGINNWEKASKKIFWS